MPLNEACRAQAGTLARHLASLPQTIASVYADCASFGSSGIDNRPPHSSVLQFHTQRCAPNNQA
eukprot:9696-Pyramimonas_sp.AAC.1